MESNAESVLSMVAEIVSDSVNDRAFLTQHVPWLFQHLSGVKVNIALERWQASDIPDELLGMALPESHASPELRGLLEHAIRQLRSMSTASSKNKGKGRVRETLSDDMLNVPSSSTSHGRTSSVNTTGSSSALSSYSSWTKRSAESTTSLESLANDASKGTNKQPGSNATSTTTPQVKLGWLRAKVLRGPSSTPAEESRSTTAANATSQPGSRPLNGFGSKLTSRVSKLVGGTKTTGTRPGAPEAPSSPVETGSQTTYECASCMEDVPREQSTILTCTHSYCSDCFGQMIVVAANTEAQWPPRCCLTEIPRDLIVKSISPAQLKTFHEKETEYGVQAENRWYCTNVPKCGKFFIPKTVGPDTVQCTHCRHTMCSTCRGKPHKKNQNCMQDMNLQATLEHARSEGWRTCTKCHSIIEYTAGCNHMTCTCGYEFCYACGKKWRTCECTYQDLEFYVKNHRASASNAAGTAAGTAAGAAAGAAGRVRNIIHLGATRPAQERQRDTRPTHQRIIRLAEERRRRREQERIQQQEREMREREEQAELQEALRAIEEQQRREAEERRVREEEEARAIEQRRIRAIDKFSEAMRLTLEHLGAPALEALRARHRAQLEEIKSIAPTVVPSVEAIRKETEEDLLLRGRLQKLDIIELNERHQKELGTFEQRYEKLVRLTHQRHQLRHQLGGGGDGDDDNYDDHDDTGRRHPMPDMQRRADALRDAQAREMRSLTASHGRTLKRITMLSQDRIDALLGQIGIDRSSGSTTGSTTGCYLREDGCSLEQLCKRAVADRIEAICVNAVADLKWYQVMHTLLSHLAADRIAHLRSSGADAPPLDGLDTPEEVVVDAELHNLLVMESFKFIT